MGGKLCIQSIPLYVASIFASYCQKYSLDLDYLCGILKTMTYTTRISDFTIYVMSPMMNPASQRYLIDLTSIVCRHIGVIRRFVQRWRMRRSPVINEADMYLCPFEPMDTVHVVHTKQGKYIFRINELQRLVRSAIEHSDGLFATPQRPKNPYTGHVFTYYNMCQIYLAIRLSSEQMHPSIFYFSKANFSIDRFVINNESMLRDLHIESTVNNMSLSDIIDELTIMSVTFYAAININMERVAHATRKKWLRFYFVAMYSYNPSARVIARNNLINHLNNYYNLL